MRMFHALWGLFLVLTPAGAISAQTPEVRFPVLRAEQAECLSDRADAYIAAGRASRPLPVGHCPDLPSPRELARLSTKNALMNPSVDAAGPLVPADPTEAMVILSRPQLECVRDHYDDIARPFDHDPGDGQVLRVVELQLDLCP